MSPGLENALSTLTLAIAGAVGAYAKSRLDAKRRRDRDIAAAAEKLRALSARIGLPSPDVRSVDDVHQAIRQLAARLDETAAPKRSAGDMEFFDRAFATVLSNEGGFVNDPKDPGGATKFGITQETLADWRGVPVSADEVKALTSREASTIYLEKYWEPSACDKMTAYPTACAIFDASILFGLRAAAVCAQAAVGAKADGHLGPATVDALNAADPSNFLRAFRDVLYTRIDDIVANRPSSKKFEAGWRARVGRYPLIT